MIRALLAAGALALVAAAPAGAARWAVGVAEGASLDQVAAEVERVSGATAERSLEELGAVVVETRAPARLRALPGVAYVERIDVGRRLAFVPNDPLASRQWHLDQIKAFDFWPEPPSLPGVRVAVIDSGIDGSHPEFAGRIAAHRSFVGGSALTDQQGHGTFVAGLLAAATGNAQGIAGVGFPAQLVVAKVVGSDKMVTLEAEAEAIRWAVARGARVINLSLGGLRDPRNPARDTYSELEAAAIRFAHARGVVVVPAVGNADEAPRAPWPYASWPAALPHVLGVAALARDGSVPPFSNRDPVYVDVAAPGQELLSTLPRALTAVRPSCAEQGYSVCGSEEYRRGEGTSFAAPLVTGAAALMLSVRPTLRPDQVSHLLTRTADDVTAATGCPRCGPGRDALSGWGRLNVARALTGAASPPAPDRFEPNDDAGPQAFRLWGARQTIEATLDYWDDQSDVYSIYLRRGQRMTATLDGPYRADSTLVLWSPSARRIEQLSLQTLRQRVAQSSRRGWRQSFTYAAPVTGWYFLQAKVTSRNAGPYKLSFVKR